MPRLSSAARTILILIGALAASAQAAELPKVKTADARAPLPVDTAASAPTVVLKKSLFRATNEKVGILQTGFFCGNTQDIKLTSAAANLAMRDIGRTVRRELDAAGYAKPPVNDSAFQVPNAAPASSDYEIGLTLRDMQMNICESGNKAEGGVWLQLRWELFSPREQKVVYSLVTEGSAQTAAGEHIPAAELAQRAQTVAVRNLLADPAFAQAALKAPEAGATPVIASGSDASLLHIAHRAVAGQNINDRVPQLQSAVVTLASGVGTGSGFYIDAQGYLLTNYHVVGDAKFIKVKLPSGRELVGEVLRSDRARDVALVKTESVALAPIDINLEAARTGDDVYALGSPLGETFAATLTRGVLSGVRTVDQQRWLQSDVRILPGSSGGPLLGRDGAAVGMTSRGIGAGMAGINLFIPIKEALDVLKVDTQAQ